MRLAERLRTSSFIRRPRLNRQGVDIGVHHRAHRRVHGAVSRQRKHSGEAIADDLDIEMTAAIAGAGVAGVALAVVDHFQAFGREGRLQGGADAFDAGDRITDFDSFPFKGKVEMGVVLAHGSTALNGRTSTRS